MKVHSFRQTDKKWLYGAKQGQSTNETNLQYFITSSSHSHLVPVTALRAEFEKHYPQLSFMLK